MSGDGAEEREGLEEGRRGGYQRAGQPSARRLSSPPPSLPPSLAPPARSFPPSLPTSRLHLSAFEFILRRSFLLSSSCISP